MRMSQYRYRYGTQKSDQKAAVLLDFIRAYVAKSGGVAPSFREMRTGVGVKSINSIYKMVRKLEAAGEIRYLPNRARALEVVRTAHYFTVERVDGEAVLVPLRRRMAA